jgi:hypothetical protein
MALAMGGLVPAFPSGTWASRAARYSFIVAPVLSVASFVAAAVLLGTAREYIFEVVVISIVWLTLIVGAIATALLFRAGQIVASTPDSSP